MRKTFGASWRALTGTSRLDSNRGHSGRSRHSGYVSHTIEAASVSEESVMGGQTVILVQPEPYCTARDLPTGISGCPTVLKFTLVGTAVDVP